nr:hypothetical protein [Geodermatophilus tzadiensis]
MTVDLGRFVPALQRRQVRVHDQGDPDDRAVDPRAEHEVLEHLRAQLPDRALVAVGTQLPGQAVDGLAAGGRGREREVGGQAGHPVLGGPPAHVGVGPGPPVSLLPGRGVESVDAAAGARAQVGRRLPRRPGQHPGLDPGGQLVLERPEQVDDHVGPRLVDLAAGQQVERRQEARRQRQGRADDPARPSLAVGVDQRELAGQPLADVHDLGHRAAAVGGALCGELADELHPLGGQGGSSPLGELQEADHPVVGQDGALGAARRAHPKHELVRGRQGPDRRAQLLPGHG